MSEEVQMEPQDAARFKEIIELRKSLEIRLDRIVGDPNMSLRVKRARLNLSTKEIIALREELSALILKYAPPETPAEDMKKVVDTSIKIMDGIAGLNARLERGKNQQ